MRSRARLIADEVEADFERAELADGFLDPDAAWRGLEALERHGSVKQRRKERVRDSGCLVPRSTRTRSGGEGGPGGVCLRTRGARSPGLHVRRVTAAYVAVAAGDNDGAGLAKAAAMLARKQGATRWRRVAELIRPLRKPHRSERGCAISRSSSPWNLTFVADLLGRRLDDLDEDALQEIEEQPTSPWPMAFRLA